MLNHTLWAAPIQLGGILSQVMVVAKTRSGLLRHEMRSANCFTGHPPANACGGDN